MIKKKIFIITINKTVIDVFLINHIKELSKKFQIEFISSYKSNKIFIKKEYYKNNFVDLQRNIGLINFFKNIKEISNIIKKNNPKIIISLHPKNGLLVAISKIFYDFKNIHIITGQVWANKKYISRFFFKCIDKYIIRNSDHLLIDSLSQIKFLKNEGFDTKKIKCINNGSICGIDTKKFYKSKQNKIKFCKKNNWKVDENIILFIGRINKHKGIFLLLEAFKILIDNNYKCNLLIVGNDEIYFKNFINKIDPNYKKRILIFNHKIDINYYYSLSSVFCLPSYREGFGMPVIEASSSFLPVVVSDIYGLNDSCINNKTGLKFKSGSSLDLVDKLKYLFNNPKKMRLFARNGKNFVDEKFNQKDVSKFIFDFIKKIN